MFFITIFVVNDSRKSHTCIHRTSLVSYCFRLCFCVSSNIRKERERERERRRERGKRAGGGDNDDDDNNQYALSASSSLVILCNKHLPSLLCPIYTSILSKKKNSFSTFFFSSKRLGSDTLPSLCYIFSTILLRLVYIRINKHENIKTSISIPQKKIFSR
jgi:hypothetical protein